MLEENRDFWIVDRETAKVIETVTGTDLRIKESEVQVNVCKAVQDLQRDAMIEAYRDVGLTDQQIAEKLVAKQGMTFEEAMEYVTRKKPA